MADFERFLGRAYVSARKVARPRLVGDVEISGRLAEEAAASLTLFSALGQSRLCRINSYGAILGGPIRVPAIGLSAGLPIAYGVPVRALGRSAANSSKLA